MRSKRRMSVCWTGVSEIALALLTTMSSLPKRATVSAMASFTADSSRTSTASARARPPAFSISAAAVWMVPSSLGCGVTVFAATAMLAPSAAALSAIANPIPREPPVTNSVLPASDTNLLRERGRRAGHAVRPFGDRPLETRRLDGDVLGEEARQGDPRGPVKAVPPRREPLPRKHASAGRVAEQPQIGSAPRQDRIRRRLRQQPLRGAREAADRFVKAYRAVAQARRVARHDLRYDAAQFSDITRDCIAVVEPQLARDEIERLDAVGPFVDRGDAGVAEMLGRAGLLDIARAAMHLHAERGDLDADVGGVSLGDGREQRGARMGCFAFGFGPPARRTVDGDSGGVTDRARSAGERPHGQEHAFDVRIVDDRAGRALLALARIADRLLGRALGDRHALQADGKPRAIHHREHARHALVLFADEKTGRAALVAIDHGAGRRGVDAELVLDRMGAHIVASPVRQNLRNQEQRDSLQARRRIGQPREHEMDDVFGQVVL